MSKLPIRGERKNGKRTWHRWKCGERHKWFTSAFLTSQYPLNVRDLMWWLEGRRIVVGRLGCFKQCAILSTPPRK